ncbi:MAG: site-2 protease family protein [Archaeoglobaceae archaeon]
MIDDRVFRVYGVEKVSDGYRFYVIPKAEASEIKRYISDLSRRYDVSLKYEFGELVLEIKEMKGENYWVNVLLFLATVASTTFAGMWLYPQPSLLGGLMFSAALMSILLSHETAHYLAARKWGMRTSLPYFIPFPTVIGTLGAVIRHRGVIPNRKALFDVGVSGPLSGLAVAILVTYIGAKIPFEASGGEVYIGVPPLYEAVLRLAGFEGEFVHPVAFAGWIGMFVTLLNMFPVGQLDGGHVSRSLLGKKADRVSKVFPLLLLAFALYLTYNRLPSSLWVFWSIFTFFLSSAPHPEPADDETPVGITRTLVGIAAFALAALCFTPVPFYY